MNAETSTLVVPMQLDALVINQPIQAGGETWNRWQMSYDQLNQYLNPEPSPFTGQQWDPPAQGVHLHWTLPDGLTHGVADATGNIEYPFIPNRWAVVRIQQASDPTQAPTIDVTVLVADNWVDSGDGAPFVDPTQDPFQDEQGYQAVNLGIARTLAQWQAQGGETGVDQTVDFLQALGPGDVSFAGYTPGNDNVVSFHDALDGVTQANLSYLVFGWYARTSLDPLQQLSAADWTDYVDPETGADDPNVKVAPDLDWAVTLDGAEPPTTTVVQGKVHTVSWDTNAPLPSPDDYPSNVSQDVRVAVGNTAADALSAMLREQAIANGMSEEEALHQAELLEAFQYHALSDLDEPGGPERLDQTIRAAAFARASGGTVWTIVPTQQADPSVPREPPTPTADQLAWLAQTNEDQARLDVEAEILATMEQRLYQLWWQNGRIAFAPTPQYNQQGFVNAKNQLPWQLKTSYAESFINAVIAQKQLVDSLQAKVPIHRGPDSAQSIAEYSEGHLDPELLQLKPADAPRFFQPSDPVLLVSGLGRSMRFEQEGVLWCRTLDQLVTGIETSAGTVTTSSLPTGTIPSLSDPTLPDFTQALMDEAFFCVPDDAGVIAEAGLDSTDPALVSSIHDDIAARTNLVGTAPSADADAAWEQPWLPLFLDWQVTFFYTFVEDPRGGFETDSRGDFIFDREDWVFDGTDYAWQGGAINEQHAITYSGRVLLTPQSSMVFKARMEQYVEEIPPDERKEVEEILQEIASWDLLSQTLAGVTSKLRMLDPDQNVPPPDDIDALVAPQGQSGSPYMEAVPDTDPSFGGGTPFFFPVRGGFLSFKNLRILDSYGRTLDLLRANGNPGGSASTLSLIHGRGLQPDPDQVGTDFAKRALQLSPRLSQHGRLGFTWMSSEDDAVPADQVGGASPVCGWLLPNHLDQSLAVYDADGVPLGNLEVFLVSATEGELVWRPAPGQPGTSPVVDPNDPPDIANAHLLALVEGLLQHADAAKAFTNFMAAIDETLWTVDPLGGRHDENLSVLIGRPLAVVRANLQLQLAGDAAVNQAWYKLFGDSGSTLVDDTGSLLDLSWPVRIGDLNLRDDGVLGYYEGGDYATFNAAHIPKDVVPASTPYLDKIGEDGNYVHLQAQPTLHAASTGVVFDPTGSVYTTLVVDPRGLINCITGLLPDRQAIISDDLVTAAADQLVVTFSTGPVLLDAETVRIPQPAEQKGTWTWIRPTGTDTDDWATDPVRAAEQQARVPDAPPILREGWLRFAPNPETT